MHTRNGIIKQIPKCMFIIYVSTANDKKNVSAEQWIRKLDVFEKE